MANPVPSNEIADFKLNAETTDEIVNSNSITTTTRTGKVVKTFEGITQDAEQTIATATAGLISEANVKIDAAIINAGYVVVGNFTDGTTLNNANDVIQWTTGGGGSGEYYRWGGSFPKVVPAASTPATTGGFGLEAWILAIGADGSTPSVIKSDTLFDAQAIAFAVLGDAVNITERTTGNGGGAIWDFVDLATNTPNGIDIVTSASPGLSLRLRSQSGIYIDQLGGIGDNNAINATNNTAVFNRAYAIQTARIAQINPPQVTRQAIPPVVWGKGKIYAINDEILLGASSVSDTQGAGIRQTDNSKDVLKHGDVDANGNWVSGDAYIHIHTGRGFIDGGKRLTVIANNNIDGHIIELDLEWHNSQEEAVAVAAVSGHLLINGKFVNNARIANIKDDMIIFQDGCWLDCNKPDVQDTGQIRLNGGTVYFGKVIGVPNGNTDSRWVDAYTNHVIFQGSRMGDEGGNAGWPFIYAYGQAPTSTRYSPLMAIRDCYTGGGNNPDTTRGLIRLMKTGVTDRVPPIISITGMTKLGSIEAISSEFTDPEFEAAIALEPALSYYEIDKVQSEKFNDLSATVPNGVLNRLVERRQSGIESPIGTDDVVFTHYATKQSLNNQNAWFEVEFHGTFANNANAKTLKAQFAGTVIGTHTLSTQDAFHGKVLVSSFDNTSVLVSYSLNTASGNLIYNSQFISLLDLQNTEYAFELLTTAVATNDINILNLNVRRKV